MSLTSELPPLVSGPVAARYVTFLSYRGEVQGVHMFGDQSGQHLTNLAPIPEQGALEWGKRYEVVKRGSWIEAVDICGAIYTNPRLSQS